MASWEASWSGSTLFSKEDISWFSMTRVSSSLLWDFGSIHLSEGSRWACTYAQSPDILNVCEGPKMSHVVPLNGSDQFCMYNVREYWLHSQLGQMPFFQGLG